MKTPREILLDQTRQHDQRLEQIQHDVITTTVSQVSKPAVSPISKSADVRMTDAPSVLTKLWMELILPARRIWLGYAFIWGAIATFYITSADHTPTQIAKTSSSEAIANWKEQQKILAELTKQPEHEPLDRPKPRTVSPRSEASHTAMG